MIQKLWEFQHMEYQYSLAHLTILGCTPPEMVYIAVRAGYDFVSLRLIPTGVTGEADCRPVDREMIRKTKAALDEITSNSSISN